MSRSIASCLGGAVLLVGLSPLSAQPIDVDPPARHVPAKPATRQELDRLEALKLYGLGAIQERQSRLIEATHTYEEAQRLDPEAAAIVRALIPLCFALDRSDEALKACRRVLELDPEDYDTGYRYARELRGRGNTKEALAVLARAAASPRSKERLEIRAQIFNDLAQMQEQAGNLKQAQKSLGEVLAILDNPSALLEQGPYNREEIDTQAAETCERLGRLYLKTGQTAEAVKVFQKGQKKDPLRSARLSYNLAEVYLAADKVNEALAELEQYLASQPQSMDGYELRIKLQRQLGREGDVLPALYRSALRDSNNTALQLLLAREYRLAGRRNEAVQIYDKLLEQSPTPEVYRGLFKLDFEDKPGGAARLLIRLDETLGKATDDAADEKDPAREQQRREAAQRAAPHARAMLMVLRDNPELVEFLLPAARPRLQARNGLKYATRVMLANLAARARKLDLAEDLYRSCLNSPGPAGTRASEPEVYSGLLLVLALAHKNQAIIDLCKEGLEKARNTNRLMFFRQLALAHMALNHVPEALAAADEAVKTAGTREQTLGCRLDRAQLLSQAENNKEAIAECQALLTEYNQTGDVHAIRLVLSGIYSAAHQADKAEEQLLLILKEDPDDATANNDLGYLWAEQNKRLDEAEQRIRRAMELDRRQRNALTSTHVGLDGDRDNAAYVDSLGWVLFRKGDWTGARRELERAVALPAGDDPALWDHLGDVCFRLKDTAKAGEAWKKAIELYESGGRRRPDERYREIKEKLRLLGP